MDMIPVTSSNIESVGYDKDARKLQVQFLNGSLYEYEPVDESVFQNLINADSVGQYFNANVRYQYNYTQVA